ncbi:LysO family transporter [Alistipes finegoldii]|uniref:lysine exporter LysO family protein n=1 Tax=Alistipes finegoldii TaxID=214856 RepID=UPI00189A2C1C|nr:lysine exporter LysO family protein [Alistipes finegoldii]
MLVLFAVIFGGIVTGRLLQSRRLAFVSRLIAVIIWALLFLLGLEVGSDPAVVGGMATLGRTAFVIFVFSVAGSIGASWLLWRRIRGRTASGTEGAAVNPASAGSVAGRGFGAGGGGCGANGFSGSVADQSSEALPNPAAYGASCLPEPSEPALFCAPCSPQSSSAACEPTPAPASPASEPEKTLSMWGALKGSLVIVAFFVAGCVAGLFALVPFDVAGARVSTYVLYVLMFCVGVTLGHDETLAGRVRRLDPRLALLPVMTAVGTLAGAALATPFLPPLAVTDTLAVGSGFGYYSLSSIFIADFRGAELGTVALLCNVMREIFTLLAAPLVARWCGPLAAVSIGGATTFDTTLPVITQAAGKPYAVVSIFHGCTLDFSVPFLVTFFCTL